ncbi:hypothetical protein RvY_14247 [Ramazzottius varieornatus]|uniref:Uncharacterized protein n=1 Tax=Ramazzottius varieornatus TaxID=947166 RepID=A0A1D1VVQ2_RAMVA|nr:hypothetical protein RvY_14247 [Ramazzottius varieornatus]
MADLTDTAVVMGVVMALDGGRGDWGQENSGDRQGSGRDSGEQRGTCPGDYGRGWPTNAHQNHDPPSKAYQVSVGTSRFVGRTLVNDEDAHDGQQSPNHSHGPAQASNRERRSQSDMGMDE